uniref:Adenosine 3'-phospho 5'-phosphosulfate transporter 2 n=1 Tax=Sinocyclocheilus grahami TaxID=75366 RepID=A0A672MR44_SINGR
MHRNLQHHLQPHGYYLFENTLRPFLLLLFSRSLHFHVQPQTHSPHMLACDELKSPAEKDKNSVSLSLRHHFPVELVQRSFKRSDACFCGFCDVFELIHVRVSWFDRACWCCVFLGKRYNVSDVSAALCMSLGLIWFTLADSKIAPNFNVTGVILISLALCFIFLFYWFCHPVTTYGYAFLFSLTGYFGISFVLALIKLFGALVAVTVTTGRKAMTIVLSFLFFSKPFTFQYVWGGLLVVFGIFLNVYSKNRDKMKLPSLADLRKRVLSGRKVRLLSQDV